MTGWIFTGSVGGFLKVYKKNTSEEYIKTFDGKVPKDYWTDGTSWNTDRYNRWICYTNAVHEEVRKCREIMDKLDKAGYFDD